LPTIVSSGTGSGKTEAFLIPILDYCLKHRDQEGVKAVLVYPMNALVNDQLKRLRVYLDGSGISFGRYTGDTPNAGAGSVDEDVPSEERSTRDDIQRRPPDILITNYAMLERLLIRRKDQEIFRHGQVRFLVMDEVHTYTGAQGAEVACLIRRFKEHVGRAEGGLVPVGTSATVKGETLAPVAAFASKLFAEEFTEDAIIQERFDEPIVPVSVYDPPVPLLTEDDLAQVDPTAEDRGRLNQQMRHLLAQLIAQDVCDPFAALSNNRSCSGWSAIWRSRSSSQNWWNVREQSFPGAAMSHMRPWSES
jgi:ATP-dependent helicase YprA (DUF1998 family)